MDQDSETNQSRDELNGGTVSRQPGAIMTERSRPPFRIFCADLNARGEKSGECGQELESKSLLLIGGSYKCGHCRGLYFIIRPSGQ